MLKGHETNGRFRLPREEPQGWLPAGVLAARIATLQPWAAHLEPALTQRERRLAAGMGAKRRGSFTAVRLCLKDMAQSLEPALLQVPLDRLETLEPGRVVPRLPLSRGKFCSAAHGGNLVIALAAERPVGADVEPLSEKAARGAGLFMSPRELRLARGGKLPFALSALRIWGLKEACAKALGLSLVQAWNGVEALSLEGPVTRASFQGDALSARHHILDNHLLTALVTPWAR